MTDISSASFDRIVGKEFSTRRLRFAVDETYWGYIVRPTGATRLSLRILQVVAMLIGCCLASAAIGLLLVPDVMTGGIQFMFRAVASIVMMGMAAFLLWFASRGTAVELQIDTSQGEVREIVRNKAGRSTQLGRYGFDAFGSVYIDRTDPNPANASLTVRYRNTSQTVSVATGYVTDLEMLKDRLGQDLILGGAAR